MNLALINPRVWIEIVTLVIFVGMCWWAYEAVYDHGARSVQMKWDAEKTEEAKQSLKLSTDALATTKSLSEALDKQRSLSNAQITALNATLGSAIAGLSNRPSRTGEGGLPSDTGPGARRGAYPSELYREDAKVALDIAADVDKLRIALQRCTSAYSAARAAIN